MRRWGLASALALWVASASMTGLQAQDAYRWQLPPGFPAPMVPADNPMSEAKADLGRHLFYDVRLSGNQTQACATCHQQSQAFTDGRPRGIGSTGESHRVGSMSLVNVAYARVLTWANPGLTRLEDQALVPLFGDHPVELGLDREGRWLGRLVTAPVYQRLFAAAYPGEAQPITQANVVRAIATFERTIVSARSPYDRYHFERDDTAISASAKRGEILFHSRPLSCFTCHGGVHFSDAMGAPRVNAPVELHNTGLYNLLGPRSFPSGNGGLYEVTRDPRDEGKFKAPSLRNIAVTAPYMHDGSVATLEDAIDHYAAGGRTIAAGEWRGVGHDNPNKSDTIRGFALTAEQRADLSAFLSSLTDDELLHDPRFANPWPASSR
jgi:cytochrome c peroxidase